MLELTLLTSLSQSQGVILFLLPKLFLFTSKNEVNLNMQCSSKRLVVGHAAHGASTNSHTQEMLLSPGFEKLELTHFTFFCPFYFCESHTQT